MSRRLRDLCRPHARAARCRPGEIHLDGAAGKALSLARRRLIVAGAAFLLAFGAIGYRLVDLGAIRAGAEAERARSTAGRTLPPGHRANIVDRNGVVLATSIRSYSIYADPSLVGDPGRTARFLHHVFPNQSVRTLMAKLARKSRFVWIQRQASPAAYQLILDSGLSGIDARLELRRIYPQRALVAHVVGSSDADNRGTAGVEARLDRRIRRDSRPLSLSIDLRVQAAMRSILARSIAHWRAIGGAALVMDVRSGEIAAMVSLPDYDPYRLRGIPDAARFNRNSLGVYELGSVFKILNTAMALEYGVTYPGELFRVDKPVRAGRRFIRDPHPLKEPASTATILVKSSNIGSALIAQRVGGPRQKAFLKRAGMLAKLPLEVLETGQPLYPKRWRPVNTLTISYGHGIAVTPVHLVAAVAGIVNDGIMVPPTLLKRAHGAPGGRRLVSSRTSRTLRDLMRQVVLKGTGKRADARGYRVGGKTGTAEKAGRGGYRRKALLSSFVAAFPIDRPRFVLLVSLDEPKGTKESHGYATAGWVAAPAARQIIERVAPILGIDPQVDEPGADEPGAGNSQAIGTQADDTQPGGRQMLASVAARPKVRRTAAGGSGR